MMNLERFKNEKVAIHCRNQEEWDLVLRQLNAEHLNYFELDSHMFESDFSYLVLGSSYDNKDMNSAKTQRAQRQTLQKHGWKIVTVQDLMIPNFDVSKALMELLDNY